MLSLAFGFYRHCLNIYAKSPSAYRLLEKVVILPSKSTLNRKKICEFGKSSYGFQCEVGDRILASVKTAENECAKSVVLLVDEMTIKGKKIEYKIYKSQSLTSFSFAIFRGPSLQSIFGGHYRIR